MQTHIVSIDRADHPGVTPEGLRAWGHTSPHVEHLVVRESADRLDVVLYLNTDHETDLDAVTLLREALEQP